MATNKNKQNGKLNDNLKIIRLEAENFKRLRAVAIEPDGSLVEITGRNGQGKTSVMDSIMAALTSGKALPDKPVREGAGKSRIVLDLGEIVVERQINPDGKTKLKVRAANGAVFGSPQALLDELIGKIAFDPLQFMRLAPREQLNQLLTVVDLGFDPEELARERAELYAERTVAGREVKRLEGALSSLPEPPPDAPEAEQSATELLAEYELALAAHKTHEAEIDRLSRLNEKAGDMRQEEERLEEKIADLRIRLEELRTEREDIEDRLTFEEVNLRESELALPNLAGLKERLDGVEELNQLFRQAREYERAGNELADAQKSYAGLNTAIHELDERKARALAAAKMPVPGLSLDEDGLILNGVPLAQASASEQLKVSTAIAMALNPRLRVITIRDGSLLDSASKAVLKQMADEQGYQVWLEAVDESGTVGVVIEDGMVAPAEAEGALAEDGRAN